MTETPLTALAGAVFDGVVGVAAGEVGVVVVGAVIVAGVVVVGATVVAATVVVGVRGVVPGFACVVGLGVE